MKKVLKSGLSVLVSLSIVFGSVYAGFSELNLSEFLVVKTKAASESDLTFVLNSASMTYSVTDCVTTAEGEMVVPDSYNDLPVTKIASVAFSDCVGLTSVVIPDSVTSIGSSAFSRCNNLVSIIIPDSVTSMGSSVFDRCEKLVSVTLPEGITSLGSEFFNSCTSLTTVNIPDSVKSIGASAFCECNSLTSITIPVNVTKVDSKAFFLCENIEKIYWNAKNVSDFTTSSGVFDGCGTAESGVAIVFGDTVERIPSYIGYPSRYQFYLTSVTISSSVKSIGDDAFSLCEYLKSVYITDIETWCNIDFGNVSSNPLYYANDLYVNGALVTDLVIPYGVTAIPDRAFYETSITSVTIPYSVKSIGSSAFSGCSELVSVTIPASVKSIGSSAFSRCSGLTSITIPVSVTSIGDSAFYHCENLEKVYWEAINVEDFKTSSNIFKEAGISGGGIEFVFSDVVERIPAYLCFVNDSSYSVNVVSVTIPDSVKSIGEDAFRSCTSLDSVYINDVGAWCNIDFEETSDASVIIGAGYSNPLFHGADLYINEELITDLVIPENATSIGNSAFIGCVSIKSVIIPNSVTSIGEAAFYGCDKLSTVTIGEKVTSIGGDAFGFCENLQNVHWNAENVSDFTEYYYVFEGTGRTSQGLEFVFGDSVERIPAQLSSANTYRPNIISVTIPKSVKSIGAYSFYGCTFLQYVFYNGSESEWANISMGENNTPLTNATIHYNSTCHTYEEKIASQVTCTEDGLKQQECIVCGHVLSSEVVSALGHKYSTNWTIDVEPTCTEDGSKSHHCTVCGDKTDITVISANGHNCEWEYDFINSLKSGYCSVCGNSIIEEITVTDVLTFTPNSSGTGYVVSDCLSEYYGVIEIPQTYNNLPVTAIGMDAFRDCTAITSVIIPDSVTSIGTSSFKNCTSLVEIQFPDNITSIPDAMCLGCTNFETLIIPGNIKNIGEYAFDSCSALKYVFFEKDETAWDKITIGTNNAPLTDAPIHFNSTGEHAFSIEWTIDKVATCTEAGSKSHHCEVCFYKTDVTLIEAIGHNYGEWIVTSVPTCTEDGSAERVCGNCEDKQEVSESTVKQLVDSSLYPESKHNYGNNISQTYEFSYEGALSLTLTFSSSTCTEDYYDCIYIYDETGKLFADYTGSSLAGATIVLPGDSFSIKLTSDDSVTEYGFSFASIVATMHSLDFIKAIGHDYSTKWTVDVDATCDEDGSMSHHCSRCDSKADVTVIPATGHNYEITDIVDSHPHTISYECSVCQGQKTEKPIVFDCLECNYTISVIDSSSYKIASYVGAETNVVIPATYNGRAITTIANGCFRDNTAITSVEISDGITSIGSIAFMNCSSLKKVVIPASVTSIGTQTFFGFTGKIYCTSGSAAHEYAVANNIDYVIMNLVDTENTQIDYDNFVIRTSVQNCDDIAKILGLSESAIVVPTASYVVGNLELYGTGTIITVFDGNDFVGDFTLVVYGDTNGDSVCDIFDCFDIERTCSGNSELSGVYAEAGDIDGDGIIDINDYQAIVNKAIS